MKSLKSILVLPFLLIAAAACDTDQSSVKPFAVKTLRAYAYPGTMTSTDSSVSVTLHLEGSTDKSTVAYTLDGSDPASSAAAQTFSDGATITVAPTVSTTTLRLYAKEGTTEVRNEFRYTTGTAPTQIDTNSLRMYQIMVEAFQNGDAAADYNAGYGPSSHKGDIQGITNALDYIKGLNVNAIWLTPVFNSTSVGLSLRATGYFADDYFNVDPHFGTNEKLRTLINEAHERGLYVFLDGVFGHHGSTPINGVTDGIKQSDGFVAKYPGSLEFFKDVALYWIDSYEIDGWRFDQAYQLSEGYSRNYWIDMRQAVETKCAARKAAGCQWGTLGYMVGEIWRGEYDIKRYGYGTDSEQGLPSCFDFPLRYNLVQVLAREETNDYTDRRGNTYWLSAGFNTHSGYPYFAQPNLMLTNHDLVRFGNLILQAYSYGSESTQYWARHRAAISFMAAFTGPITLYYGDEIGDYLPGYLKSGNLGYYNDHVARSNGIISGFTANQQALHDYVAALMQLKAAHPALWRGTRTNLSCTGSMYADFKYDSTSGEKLVYVLNAGTSNSSVTLSVGGASKLTRIPVVSMEPDTAYTGSGSFTVNLNALTGAFFKVE